MSMGRTPTQTPAGLSRGPAQYGFNAGTGKDYRGTQGGQDLAGLIKQQPLPYDQTQAYRDMQAMIAAQQAQLGTYGSQVAGLQGQLTQLAGQDPTRLQMRRLIAMQGIDPLAQYRNQIQRMYNPMQHMNLAVPMYGFESTWSG